MFCISCSDEGGNFDPAMVPAVFGANGSAETVYVDHISEHRIRRRTGPSQGNLD